MAIHPVAALPDVCQRAFPQAIKNFRSYLLADKGLSPNTAIVYSRMLAKLLEDIGTETPTLQQYREHLADLRARKYSHTHITNTCRVIEAYTSMQGEMIPFARGRRYSTSVVESLSEGEVAIILNACQGTREKAVVSILAYSGMRNEELCQLRVADIRMGEHMIVIKNGKGNEGRAVRVSAKCIGDIRDYLSDYPRQDDELLFVSLKRQLPFEGSTIRRMVRRIVARTRIAKKVSPHIFRHSLAVNMLSRGANIFAIKEILGHSRVGTTLLYLRSVDPKATTQYELFCPSYS